jgi:hypothetical protein
MSVDDVIKLSKAGLSDDLIIQQIKKKGQRFDLSTDQLLQLKAAHVSERVIQAMIDPTKVAAPISTQKTENSVLQQSPQPSVPSSAVTPVSFASAAQSAATPAVTAQPVKASSQTEASLPSKPGMYLFEGHQYSQILGQPVAFERTGSRLVSGVTLHIKAAHNNIQIPGHTARTITSADPVFAFIPTQHEAENGVTAGDLILIKLETHGDRRQIEVAAGGTGRGSAGVSITHQLAATRSEPVSGSYEIRPVSPLRPGEYAIYLQRGEGLPAMLYDFSVQMVSVRQ